MDFFVFKTFFLNLIVVLYIDFLTIFALINVTLVPNFPSEPEETKFSLK